MSWQTFLNGFAPGGNQGVQGRQAEIDERKQRIQQSAEDHDKAMGDYMDSIGAQPVQSGMVHRQMFTPPVNMGDYSDIPGVSSPGQIPATSGYVLDKADPARIVTHKTADGQTVQWERPTIEQQKLRQALLKLAELQNPQNKEAVQIEDTRQANRAGAVAESTARGTVTGRENALQTARSGPAGIALPPGSGVADGQKFLPDELPSVVAGVTGATELPGKIQQARTAMASQKLGTVTTPGAYKIVYGTLDPQTQALFDSPDQYEQGKSQMRANLAGITDPAQRAQYTALSSRTPKDWYDEIDGIAPPAGTTSALNKRLKIQVDGALRTSPGLAGVKDARTIIDKASEQLGAGENSVRTANATAPIKINIANTENANRLKTTENATGLGPDDYARAGQQYGMTGVMPPMGRDSVTRGKIMKAANDWARDNGFSAKDIVTMQAAFAGDKESLKKFQGQRDQIASFESTATKNLDLFLDAASKIPDTGSPWLNAPLRSLDANVVGSANMAAVNAARQVANNEIAKVTSGGGLSGVLSDSARHEVEAYNPANATFKQTIAVAKVLKQDMANRRASMDATLGEIKGRIGNRGNPGGGNGGGDTYLRKANGPNGHTIGQKADGGWYDIQTDQRVQ